MSKQPLPGPRRTHSPKKRKLGPGQAKHRPWQQALAANAETVALIALVAGGLLILNLANSDEGSASLLTQLVGWGAWPVALALVGASLAVLARPMAARLGWDLRTPQLQVGEALVGVGLIGGSLLGLSHVWRGGSAPLQTALAGKGGGLVGWVVGTWPATLLGDLITTLFLLVLTALGAWLAVRSLGPVSVDWKPASSGVRGLLARLLPDDADEQPPPPPKSRPQPSARRAPGAAVEPPSPFPDDTPPSLAQPSPAAEHAKVKRKQPAASPPRVTPIKPKPRPAYLPPLTLLSDAPPATAQKADLQARTAVIEETLASFGVPVRVVDINVGPAVTQFGVEPGYLVRRTPDGQEVQRRVRVSRIKALADDLALALEAKTIRIEAPVPGKGYVGIEVPNSTASQVSLRAVIESPAFQRLNSPLAIALGRDVAGQPTATNLAALPHLLIAGSTGSGKSVCIHSIITSLLLNNGPDRLRLLLIDPKRVELTVYNGAPHLLAPVVTDSDQVVGALTWLTLQMDERYRAFARVGARHIEDFNAKVGKKRLPAEWSDLAPLPYLVLVIDEMADLIVAAPDSVEHLLCRLAQMARATGIHLVVATQRPSVDVVTGLIKANFPARIAFAVTSQTDSRVILDTPGAEKLLGRGDMLFMRPDSSKLDRVQGCLVSQQEIEQVVQFWKTATPAETLPANAPRYPWTGLLEQLEDQDVLYERALDLVQEQERISTSWLQRRLRVGYNKAAELIARMEADGYVGPDEGAGRGREVLLADASDQDDEGWLSGP